MTAGTVAVVAFLVLIALGFGPLGRWVRRRNMRQDGARESMWLHSRERGDEGRQP